jgi:hypothetical protein
MTLGGCLGYGSALTKDRPTRRQFTPFERGPAPSKLPDLLASTNSGEDHQKVPRTDKSVTCVPLTTDSINGAKASLS